MNKFKFWRKFVGTNYVFWWSRKGFDTNSGNLCTIKTEIYAL